MHDPVRYVEKLIELHLGLERQGPGDLEVARAILERLPPLPPAPRIADLGCGTGTVSRFLADRFRSQVLAVDFAAAFLAELRTHARDAGLDHLIQAIEQDMGSLDWPDESLDLIWSEGAVYNIGFENALTRWHRLLAAGGIVVVSEMSWFSDDPPKEAKAFWTDAYPALAGEPENLERAERAGYCPLFHRRLDQAAWWSTYYDPLHARIDRLGPGEDQLTQRLISEIREEMDLFRRFGATYGYTYYVMRKV